MADETKRIIDQDNDQTLAAGDYVMVDSQAEGTRKFDLGTELSGIKADLGDLSSLETTAKNNLVAAINEAAQSGGSGSGGITVVDTVAEMVDTESVYLYNGTQTGYTAGHWYFYNTGTSAWTDGGEYTGWETVDSAVDEYLQANAQEIKTLYIVVGGTNYTYNGSANV